MKIYSTHNLLFLSCKQHLLMLFFTRLLHLNAIKFFALLSKIISSLLCFIPLFKTSLRLFIRLIKFNYNSVFSRQQSISSCLKKSLSSKNYLHVKRLKNGFTFIEVLVAFILFVTGTLGAVALQATAQKSSFEAMQRTLAILYTQDMIERIKSNSTEVITLKQYEGRFGSDSLVEEPSNRCNSVSVVCNTQERVLNDIYEWNQLLIGANVQINDMNVGGLIESTACIEYRNNKVTIYIGWGARESSVESSILVNSSLQTKCETTTLERRQFIASVFIY